MTAKKPKSEPKENYEDAVPKTMPEKFLSGGATAEEREAWITANLPVERDDAPAE